MNGTYGGRGSLRSLLLVLVTPASVMVEKIFPGEWIEKQPVASLFMGYNRLFYSIYNIWMGFPDSTAALRSLKTLVQRTPF